MTSRTLSSPQISSYSAPTRRFFALFLGAPWLAISLCVAVGALWPQTAGKLGGWALLFSAVAFGMPHGAADLWAMQQAVRRTSKASSDAKSRKSSTRFGIDLRWLGWMTAYVSSAALMLLLWRLDATLALGVFLLLTMWHFGSADAWLQQLSTHFAGAQEEFSSRNTSRRALLTASRLALSWGRGLLVINAPLVFQNAATQEILERFVALSGTHAAASNAQNSLILWRIAPWLLALGLALQVTGHFMLWLTQSSESGVTKSSTRFTRSRSFSASRTPLSDISMSQPRFRAGAALWLETAGLLVLFAVAPPLLAVSCYFLAVHAWRHVLRLEIFADATAQNSTKTNGETASRSTIFSASLSEIARGVWRQHHRVFTLTLAALLGIVPILLCWPSLFRGGIAQWNTAYLILISAVTVPHVTVVSWLEARHDF